MHLPIVFVSSALFLAGLNAAYPVATRFADSDALSEFSARAFEEELEFYARGADPSKKPKKLKKSRESREPKKSEEEGDPDPRDGGPPGYHVAEGDPPPYEFFPKKRTSSLFGLLPTPPNERESWDHRAGPSSSRSRRAFYHFD